MSLLCRNVMKARLLLSWSAMRASPVPSCSLSTVDEAEISRMDKLFHNWWDQHGEMKALHAMNDIRVPLVVNGLVNVCSISKEKADAPEPLHSMNVLDVGCGGGIFSESCMVQHVRGWSSSPQALARLGANVTGLDPNENMICIAQQHGMKDESICSRLKYVCSTVEDHVESTRESYDIVVSSETIEHVLDQELFLDSCAAVLKPGGSIFLTTFNKTFASWLVGIVVAEKILRIIPEGIHDWQKFISPHTMTNILEKRGCCTKLIHGMTYNFLNNRWYWIRNTSISYALHAVKDEGIK